MTRTSYDMIVIGGGVVGASTAYTIANTGQRVLLLDQYEPGHTQGSSHGDGRIVRFNYPQPIYVEMAMLAYPGWEALQQRAGKRLVQKTGLWECGYAGSPIINELVETLSRYDIAFERLSADESRQRFPQLWLDAGSEAIYQADGMVAFATQVVQTYWRLAVECGADTRTGVRVKAIEPNSSGVTVCTTDGEAFTAPKAVLTAGGWAKTMLSELGLDLPLKITQEHIAYFAPKDDTYSHRVGDLPNVIDQHEKDIYYALPQVEITGVKAGFHGTGPVIDPDKRPEMNMSLFEPLSAWIERRYAYLRPEPTNALTCLYTNTPDEDFILDRHPDAPNLIIGSGFSGHGFKFAPVLGQILSALALDESPPLPLDTFRLDRF